MESAQDPARAQALRLVSAEARRSPAARRDGSGIELAMGRCHDEEDEWASLLSRAKADASRSPEHDEEDEWAVHMQRVKAELARSEEDEWAIFMARARALQVDAPAKSSPAPRPVARTERQSSVQSARARMVKAPAKSSEPRPADPSAEAPALYFTLPGEKPEEPARLPEEVSKVVARASVMGNPPTGTRPALAPSAPRASAVPQQPATPPAPRVEAKREPARPEPQVRAPEAPRTSLTEVPRTSLTEVPRTSPVPAPRKTLPEARRTSYIEARRAAEPRPEPAPRKSTQSSPGMAALRVAATKRAAESSPRPAASASAEPAPRASLPQPAKRASDQAPKKKDSSLVGLSVALVESMHLAQRASRAAPPPPPSAAYTARGSVTAPARQQEPAAPGKTRSGLAPLKIPAPPARSSTPARRPLSIPAPPPPSRAKQSVPGRVVSRVRDAVAALTRRGGLRG